MILVMAFVVATGVMSEYAVAAQPKKKAQTTGQASPRRQKKAVNASAQKKSDKAQSTKKSRTVSSPKSAKSTKSAKSAKPAKQAQQRKTPSSSAEAKRMQEAANKEIQATKEKIRLNDKEIKEGLADLNRLSAEISTGRKKVDNLQAKISSLQTEITTISGSISSNEKELQRMRDEYLKAIKKMRLNRKNRSMLAFIFASEDFNQALRRLRYMRQFFKWKERKSEEIHTMIVRLDEQRASLAGAKESQSLALSQLSKTQAELETKHAGRQHIVEGLKQNGEALQKHLSQKQAEANQLRNTIADLIAREQAKAEAERKAREKAEAERIARQKAEQERLERQKAEERQLAEDKAKAAENAKKADENARKAAENARKADENARKKAEDAKKKEQNRLEKERKKAEKEKAKSERTARHRNKNKDKDKAKATPPAPVEEPRKAENTSKPKPAVEATASNFSSMKGKLPRPVGGAWRITNPFGRHSMPELPEVVYDNPGIDAEVAMGAQVKAVAGGKVSGVYKIPGYGNVVIVNHGDYYTVYGNLSAVNVAVGNSVAAGSGIGSAGADPDDARRGSVHFEVWHGREKQNPELWLQ